MVGCFDLDRFAGGDVAEDGHLEEVEGGAVAALVGWGRAGEVAGEAGFLEAVPVEAEAAAYFLVASDQLVLLQFGEVVLDDGGAGDAAGGADVADRGGVVVFLDEFGDEGEHALLAVGKFHFVPPFGLMDWLFRSRNQNAAIIFRSVHGLTVHDYPKYHR